MRTGGLVAFPTETVYGLGANALDPKAVLSIFEAKGRPSDNPLIVHIINYEQAQEFAKDIPKEYYELCRRFSPGPLTVILKKRDSIPMETSGGLDTVALRIPSHPVARELIRIAGVPIAAPSANLSGSPSPTTARHCIDDLWGRLDAIVDGGACSVGVESTVITLAEDTPCLLRPGAVTPEMLSQVLGKLKIHHAVMERLNSTEKAFSPGMKYKHYAPKARIIVVNGSNTNFAAYANSKKENGVFALCFDEDIPALQVPFVTLGEGELAQAQHLFSALRELDDRNAKTVYAHCPAKKGLGLAVYNRLIRAAAYEEKNI